MILLIISTWSVGTAQLTIIIDHVPDHTPPNDPIHIAGDFQGWDATDINFRLTKNKSTGDYFITLPDNLGNIEFKFARGNWDRVETTQDGSFRPNRMVSTSVVDTLLVQIAEWEDLLDSENNEGESTAAENVSILTDSFYIPQLNRYRRVWLYLPPNYKQTDQRYPVIYMHDGQNVFDEKTSYAGEWKVDETLNKLFDEGDPGVILVAVDNGRSYRTEEYTAWPHPEYGGGKGKEYVQFIVEILKPYIDQNYRTLSDRDHTAIAGSSLGGLISTYAGIEYQNIFSKVGSFSPAYWFALQSQYHHVIKTRKQQDMRIYQLAGTLEGSQYVDNMFAMEDTLIAAGYLESEVFTIEHPDGDHSEPFWAREFEDVYKWLFERRITQGINSLKNVSDFRLSQNPKTGDLIFQFQIKHPTDFQIDLIDQSGNQVRLYLTTATLFAGQNKFQWNMHRLGLLDGEITCLIKTEESTISLPIN